MKQRYDSYKPSGIEWIGEIPSHWQIVPLKYVLDNLDYLREPISADERERNNPIYDYYGASGVIDKIDYYNVEDTVLLIGEDGANLVMRNLPLIYKATGKFWVNNHAHILKPKYDNSYQYLAHLLEAGDYSLYITGSAQPKLSQENLNNFILCIPPLFEQEAIAAWLDEKCGEIDAAIAKVDREIGLIDELKQSEISRVVTRGLNPNVKFRPSGIDWIGEIPSHWTIQPIKYPFTLFSGATPKTENKDFWDGDLDWITPADYKTEDHYIFSSNKQITQQGKDSCATELVPPGSIIFSKRAPIGTVAIASIPLCTNQGCISCVPKSDTDSSYYYYLFSIATTEFENHGSGATFLEISATSFANFKIVVPPLAEQREIADYLDKKCAEIDGLKSKLKKKRDTIVELRQAMISEVVTGKRKVI